MSDVAFATAPVLSDAELFDDPADEPEPPAEMTARAVHVEPEYRTERLRTFDADRGDTKEPVGEQVVEAWTEKTLDPATGLIAIVDHPEIRIPYWELDDTVLVNQPTDCPDCTRGIVANDLNGDDFGVFLQCITVDIDNHADPCHTGCLVACGHPV